VVTKKPKRISQPSFSSPTCHKTCTEENRKKIIPCYISKLFQPCPILKSIQWQPVIFITNSYTYDVAMTLYTTLTQSLMTLICHNSGTLSRISYQSILWTEFSWILEMSDMFGEKHLNASFWNEPQSQTLRIRYVKLCSLSYHDPLGLH